MLNTAITIAGQLADDPRLRMVGDKPKTTMRVLVNHRRRQSDGTWTEAAEPTGFDVEAWGALATNAAEQLSQGTRVIVHGHLETVFWTDENTQRRRRSILSAHEIGRSLATRPATT